jgi:hypothetical protein
MDCVADIAPYRPSVVARRHLNLTAIRRTMNRVRPAATIIIAADRYAEYHNINLNLPGTRQSMKKKDYELNKQSLRQANSHHTTPAVLAVLAGHGVRLVRELVAGNANANPADLESLATDPEPLVRERAAWNPTLAPSILDRMARDGSSLVCATVARQSALSLGAMEVLVAHPSAPVRFALARNPSLTTAVLSQLARDGDWRVCAAVAQHPGLTADIIEHLLWHENSFVRLQLAEHQKLSVAQRGVLRIDASVDVRKAVRASAEGEPRIHLLALFGWDRRHVNS